jgi:DNA-binding transcriptional regulator YiaG
MSNLVLSLKQEIGRIARKEVRADTTLLKKHSAKYRSEIAGLKRQIEILERQLKSTLKKGRSSVQTMKPSDVEGDTKLRFRAEGFANHRKRLGLSAREAGQLIGVSQLTVYHWEKGETRPRESQMAAIDAFRKLGRREAIAKLEAS